MSRREFTCQGCGKDKYGTPFNRTDPYREPVHTQTVVNWTEAPVKAVFVHPMSRFCSMDCMEEYMHRKEGEKLVKEVGYFGNEPLTEFVKDIME